MKDKIKQIKELQKQKNELSKQIKDLEKEVATSKQLKKKEEREKYIGKCFKLLPNTKSTSYRNVIAFEILGFHYSDTDYNYLNCKTIVDGFNNTCFEEFGVVKQTLSLFSPDVARMVCNENDPKTIDRYQEISKEEFDNLVQETIAKL